MNATLEDAQATGTILNDDAPPSVSIQDTAVREGDAQTSTQFTLRLSQASGVPVTVDFSTGDGSAHAGTDYLASHGTVTFAPGQLGAARCGSGAARHRTESDESFVVQLSDAHNATIDRPQATATILDTPTISIGDVTISEGAGAAVFSITASRHVQQDVTVTYVTKSGTAEADRDFQSTENSVVISAGSNSATIAVPLLQDQLVEDDEQFLVTLLSATNATLATDKAIGTIRDDEEAGAISIGDVTLIEGDSGSTNAVFTVTLAHPVPDRVVTVSYRTRDGTAVAEDPRSGLSDYAFTAGALSFDFEHTQRQISVLVAGDTLIEGDQTFYVDLFAPTDARIERAQAIATIQDNEAPPQLSVSDAIVDESTGNVRVEVNLSQATEAPVTVHLATADGTAAAPQDYASSAATVSFAPDRPRRPY